jgi:probable rRNA maturation factor
MSARPRRRRSSTVRRRSAAPDSPNIAVLIEAPEWRTRVRGVARIAERAARAAVTAKRLPLHSELCLVLANDTSVRRLNRQWRGKDKPTNVLSFPALDRARRRGPAGVPTPLGDVIIAAGVAASEADAQGKTLAAHLSHLVVHGVLHLLGYDHEAEAEATRMERLEVRILAGLGVANPYLAVSSAKRARPS